MVSFPLVISQGQLLGHVVRKGDLLCLGYPDQKPCSSRSAFAFLLVQKHTALKVLQSFSAEQKRYVFYLRTPSDSLSSFVSIRRLTFLPIVSHLGVHIQPWILGLQLLDLVLPFLL